MLILVCHMVQLSLYSYLNTSYVNVNPYEQATTEEIQHDLNTSYVNVNRTPILVIESAIRI